MDELWSRFVSHHGNLFLYAVMPTIVVNAAYLVGCAVSAVLDAMPSLRPYKIQEKVQTRAEWGYCLGHLTLNKLISEIPLTFAAYPAFVWLGVRKEGPLPSANTIILTLIASFIVEDAWHYFAHRTLHLRWAFKHIHYQHHRYTTPFGPAANFAHPLETLFTGFGTVLPVLMFRPHLYTLLIWVAVRQWQAMSVHVGYDFPWRPSRWLPFLGGARFHDRHHRRFNRNYAPTFVWIDRLLGTADEKNLGPRRGAPDPVIAEE